MINFRAPGMAADPGVFRQRALIFLAVLAVLVPLAVWVTKVASPAKAHLTIRADYVASGIVPGSAVVIHGAELGTLEQVSVPAPGQFALHLVLDDGVLGPGGLVTARTDVTYAPKNLFGISAIVLDPAPGHPLADGSELAPASTTDATLTSLLRQLTDLQNDAFDPHMGEILATAGRAVRGLAPVAGIAGEIGKALADTQRIAPRQSLPLFSRLVTQLSEGSATFLPAFEELLAWEPPRREGFQEAMYNGLLVTSTLMADDLDELSGPRGLTALSDWLPPAAAAMNWISRAFPGSRANGEDVAELIGRLEKALADGPGGPRLRVDVMLASVPGVTAALGAR
ncbi:hypothetical protein GOHSU_38_00430 [Gordonia hirsuta DSM 44140 = NBRC 16056]|uniref:Mce family protein n=1 Tax=Gordonia hirsuta DSM 44140 = NBRC 16056 TaxID=1121927 RepID=L7LBU9_9ACTN|nr:hypothetical protein [Gordonia hirsuta]GAC58404.1 hypothetical protein GOHSU_38_00430 [Gordonia hirsuta DSM 44140 = NBRC 16056]